jgi:predicted secreted protein
MAVALSATAASAHEEALTYDRIDLRVSAEEAVDNDTLVVSLYAERQEARQRDAADAVNEAVRWGLEQAKSIGAVRAQTLGYRSNPVYRNQSLSGWRVRQSLRLESTDADALSTLVGELQARLAIELVEYDVSPAARTESEERLIARALDAFQARARLVAERLGRSEYRIVRLDVGTQGRPPGPVPVRMAVMAAEAAPAAAPALKGGEQELRVTVTGTIELQL